MKRLFVFIFVVLIYPAQCLALPVGDTQGFVKAVRVLGDDESGNHRIQIWFETTGYDNDRWGCITSNSGLVLVSTAAPYTSPTVVKMILSVAMTAQVTGKKLALDSTANNSCNTGVYAWILD